MKREQLEELLGAYRVTSVTEGTEYQKAEMELKHIYERQIGHLLPDNYDLDKTLQVAALDHIARNGLAQDLDHDLIWQVNQKLFFPDDDDKEQ